MRRSGFERFIATPTWAVPRPARDIVTVPAAADLDVDRTVALFAWVPGANLNLTAGQL